MKSDCSAQELLLSPNSTRASLSLTEATMLLCNIALGILLVIAPLSLYSTGWLVGILSLLLGSMLQIQAGYVLIRIIASSGAYTYQDIAKTLLGKNWVIILNLIVIFGQNSVCVGVIYISAASLKGFLSELFDNPPSWISSPLCIFIAGIIIFPFAIKKEIKGIRAAAFIMLSLIFIFLLTLLIYYITNYSDLRQSYPTNNFTVPILPEKSAQELIPKITIMLNGATFNQASSPILSSIKQFSHKRALIPVIAATIFSMVGFFATAALGASLFGELITSADNLIKVLFMYSRSYITLVTQLLFSFIGIYHSPVYLFSARESALLFFNNLFQWARKEHSSESIQSPFPKMYDRVPRWLFYTVAFVNYIFIVLITLFIENLVSLIQILGLPILVFLNYLFPNIAILAARGVSKEPLALICLVVGILSGLLPLIFGLIAVINGGQ